MLDVSCRNIPIPHVAPWPSSHVPPRSTSNKLDLAQKGPNWEHLRPSKTTDPFTSGSREELVMALVSIMDPPMAPGKFHKKWDFLNGKLIYSCP